MRFLVTAGNTRELIDRVRDWGNIFTGNTGYAIARALAAVGPVDLLTSNRQHIAEASAANLPHPVVGTPFTSHADLRNLLAQKVPAGDYDAIVMTAAVADYRPVRVYAVVDRQPDPATGEERWVVRDVQAGKVRSTHAAIAILGEPTEKLVDLFRTAWGYCGILVKFKLEVGLGVEDLLKIGENSRLASGADYLVANTLEMVEGPRAGAYLLHPGGHEFVPRANLAARLVSLLAETTPRGGDGK